MSDRGLLGLSSLLLLPLLVACQGQENQAVSGSIEAPPEVVKAMTHTSTLFIAVKADGAVSGPPMAALKVVGAKLPYAFSISADDVLMPGQHFGGKMRLAVHLRRSGMVDVPTPGDASGQAESVLEPGATGVVVRLVPLK